MFPDQIERRDLREIEEHILLTEVDEDDLQEETDWTDTKFEFDLPIHLADYQKEEFVKFLEANRERFATTMFDLATSRSLTSSLRQRSRPINTPTENLRKRSNLSDWRWKKCFKLKSSNHQQVHGLHRFC